MSPYNSIISCFFRFICKVICYILGVLLIFAAGIYVGHEHGDDILSYMSDNGLNVSEAAKAKEASSKPPIDITNFIDPQKSDIDALLAHVQKNQDEIKNKKIPFEMLLRSQKNLHDNILINNQGLAKDSPECKESMAKIIGFQKDIEKLDKELEGYIKLEERISKIKDKISMNGTLKDTPDLAEEFLVIKGIVSALEPKGIPQESWDNELNTSQDQ